MEGGLATFVLEPAFVLSLFVGAFHTCIYIFVRGNLGWHIPAVLVGGILGALVGQAIGARIGDLLHIGDYSLHLGLGHGLDRHGHGHRREHPCQPPSRGHRRRARRGPAAARLG